jgi:hypothetical protein
MGVLAREGRTAERARGTLVGRGPVKMYVTRFCNRDVAATCSVHRSRGARRGRGGAEGFSGGRVGEKCVVYDGNGRRLRAEGALG